ncbi:MAG: AsmA-like C-terminal region-containing protein [Victivallaceae bacterium]|nr:AsmA-like C-terminal region-containing protein [Victivallaceae bacterium]
MKNFLRFVVVTVAVLLLLTVGIYFLISGNFGMQKILLPILRASLDAEIRAENCEISLFGENTLTARGFALKKDVVSVAAREILLQTHPLAFVFGSPLTVENLSLAGLTVEADTAAPEQQKPAAPPARSSGKDADASGSADLKYEIKKVSVSDGKITCRDHAGRKIELDGIRLTVKDVRPGAEMILNWEAFASVTAPDVNVARAGASLTARVKIPEKFGLPPSAAMQFSFGETRVAAGDFSVPDVAVALALDAASDERHYEIKTAKMHIGSRSAGDLLDLQFSGSADAAWRNGDLNGDLKVYAAPLTDALLSGLSNAQVDGFTVAGNFAAAFRDGKINSGSAVKVSARKITVQGSGTNGVFVSPVVGLTAEMTGDSEACDLTLTRARLDVECDKRNLATCALEKPWNFLQRGALKCTECPQADLHADAFPLRLLNPWSKDEWKDETVRFKVRSGAEGGDSTLAFEGKTSFPVGTEHCSGLLKAGFTLNVNSAKVLVSDGRMEIDAPQEAVKAAGSGAYETEKNAFQANCEWNIQNPAASLNMPQFSDRKELNPVIRASGAFDRERRIVKFQTRVSETRYDAELGGTLFLPDHAYQLRDGVLLLRVDGADCGKLSAQGTIPKDGDWSKLDLSLATQTPFSGRGLALKTPGKWDLAHTALDLTAEVRDGTATGRFSAATRWAEKPLHGAGSWNVKFKDFIVREAEVAMRFESGKDNLADLQIKGIFPEFRVASTGVDVRKIQAFFEGGEAAAVKKNTGKAGKAGKENVEATVQDASEPDALDLSALDGLKVALDFRNITYTGDLNLDVSGLLRVEKNVVRLDNGKITVNRAPATFNAALDVGQSGGWHYSVKGKASALDIAPVARALRDGRDPGIGGTLKNFNLELSGQGISGRDLMKRSRGKADFAAEKLHLSLAEQSDDALLLMLLIPVRALPDVIACFPDFAATETGKTLTGYAQKLKPILNGEEDFIINELTGKISIDRGLLRVDKVVSDGGTIKRETISGNAELPAGAVDLQSEMLLDDLAIPLAVGGTLAKPQPDWKKTIQKLGSSTLKNALKPENINQTVKDVKNLIELFR